MGLGVEGSSCVGSSLPAYAFLLRQIVCHRRAQAQPALAHRPRCRHTPAGAGHGVAVSASAGAPGHDDTRHNMVPQELLFCRQLFCFTAIAIVLPTQRAQLHPITLLQCETRLEPSATMAYVEQFLCRPRERRVCKGIAPFDRQRLLPLQYLFAPHYWHETVAYSPLQEGRCTMAF